MRRIKNNIVQPIRMRLILVPQNQQSDVTKHPSEGLESKGLVHAHKGGVIQLIHGPHQVLILAGCTAQPA